jgi:hypothetical protein
MYGWQPGSKIQRSHHLGHASCGLPQVYGQLFLNLVKEGLPTIRDSAPALSLSWVHRPKSKIFFLYRQGLYYVPKRRGYGNRKNAPTNCR